MYKDRVPLRRSASRRVVTAGLAAALLATSTFAYATRVEAAGSVDASWQDCISKAVKYETRYYSYANSEKVDAETAFEGLPKKYDLRDPNGDGDRSDSVVSPVKRQDPWGTCWAFSICAASETSILSEAGLTWADCKLDLSELQVARAAYRNGGAPESIVGTAQAGEGFHTNSEDPNFALNKGGYQLYGSSIFSSGIGPVLESDAPYQNKEGIIVCRIVDEATADQDDDQAEKLYLTQEEYDAKVKEGVNIKRLYWVGNYEDANGKEVHTDWSVDDSLWNASILSLENGNVLPSPTVLKLEGDNKEYDYTDLKAVAAIKREICQYGRAVTVSYNGSDAFYDPTDATHYCDWATGSNHAVCIVGFDDDITFTSDDPDRLPPGKGAWLVKNNWGAQSEDFPNYGEYGIIEDGEHTGYFWLSYYDVSADNFETFDFDLESYGDDEEYYIDQYDYLVGNSNVVNSFDTPTSSANIFTAEGDLCLRTLGCSTFRPNTTVGYQVYLLDDNATSPTDPEHAKLAYSFTDTYQYGGYHRASLAEDSWVAMRAGQRYAVVTTQFCNDDGKWYQGSTINSAKDGFQARVNAGESWTGTTALASGSGKAANDAETSDEGLFADGQTSWRDWTEVVAVAKAKESDAEIDNLTVKAFSEKRSWASVDELRALEDAIAKAQSAIDSSATSADGTDVAKGVAWMTQAQKDSLAEALDAARSTLALAGDDYASALANTTPSSATVAEATGSLTFEQSLGTMSAEKNDKTSANKTAANQPASSNAAGAKAKKAATPSTGDASSPALLAALLTAGGAAELLRRRFFPSER